MSIGGNLQRIKNNITAALAAIADKGVTVPDGSTSDALAELIASIEAGGNIIVETGSITLAADNAEDIPVEIESKGYAFPDAVIIYRTATENVIVDSYVNIGMILNIYTNKTQESYSPTAFQKVSYDIYTYHYNNGTSKIYMPFVRLGNSRYLSNKSPIIPMNFTNTNTRFKADTTYKYIFIWGVNL